jgi:integrase
VTFGGAPVSSLNFRRIRKLRDRKSDTPAAANGWIKALRQVFEWGKQEGDEIEANPAREVGYLPGRVGGHPAWDEIDVERFLERHPPGTKAALALAILLFTGQRRSDVVVLGKQHLRRGELTFTQVKNRNRAPVTLTIPVHPRLEEFISMPPVGDLQFLVTEFGKPFTGDGFGNWFRDRCREAGVKKSPHGCRKTAAAILAELGCSSLQIAAITGHRSLKEVERYTKSADQKRLARAAMAMWAKGQMANENAQESDAVVDPWAKPLPKSLN